MGEDPSHDAARHVSTLLEILPRLVSASTQALNDAFQPFLRFYGEPPAPRQPQRLPSVSTLLEILRADVRRRVGRVALRRVSTLLEILRLEKDEAGYISYEVKGFQPFLRFYAGLHVDYVVDIMDRFNPS